MSTIFIDEPDFPFTNKIEYSPLYRRFFALAIDTVLLFIVVLPLEYYNITELKNSNFLFTVSIFAVFYKPFFEFKYGATPGKKIMGIKVISHEYNKLRFSRAAVRNIFFVIPAILTTLITIFIYNQPEFLTINSFVDYLTVLARSKSLSFINITVITLNAIDSVSILIDKKNRSIHDIIAGTIVVKNN